MEITMSEATNHYVEPGWFTRNVFNRSIAFLTRHGVSVWGSRELRVRGRKSGEWRKVEAFTIAEVDGDAKVEVLRAYLRKWKMEVGVFFDGTSADSTDEEIAAIAPKHPVFLVTSTN